MPKLCFLITYLLIAAKFAHKKTAKIGHKTTVMSVTGIIANVLASWQHNTHAARQSSDITRVGNKRSPEDSCDSSHLTCYYSLLSLTSLKLKNYLSAL